MEQSSSVLPSHQNFVFPRLPAHRLVQVNWTMSDRPARDFAGLFWTSGVKHIGEANETYILRRVAAPDSPVEFLEVPRRWQENGAMTVFDVIPDHKYMPPKAA